jgi:hypothetical protein
MAAGGEQPSTRIAAKPVCRAAVYADIIHPSDTGYRHSMTVTIRQAVFEDIPVLEQLVIDSVRGLQKQDYTPEQIEGALGTVFGVDKQLIRDGTYFIAEEGTDQRQCRKASTPATGIGTVKFPAHVMRTG